MTLPEACAILNVDQGVNDALIQALIDAIPDYIEATTGLAVADQPDQPLVMTASRFILTQWYYADHADDLALERVISNLLKVITIRAHDTNETV